MTPTPEIITASLKLPIEARRALAAQPGPGWWVSPRGTIFLGVTEDSDCTMVDEGEKERMVLKGWAWLPADSVAWMEAACVGTFEWSRVNKRWFILDYVLGYTWAADSAQECALKRWGAL